MKERTFGKRKIFALLLVLLFLLMSGCAKKEAESGGQDTMPRTEPQTGQPADDGQEDFETEDQGRSEADLKPEQEADLAYYTGGRTAQEQSSPSAQVILRWNLQKGVVVIPGSSNPEHIQENTELFDFELTDDEMGRMNALDRNEKHDWY